MNNPFDLQNRFGKIDKQPMFLSQGLKIGFHDCKMDILDIFYRLQLNHNRVSYNEIKPMPSNFDPVIFDDNFPLLFKLKLPFS